MAATTAEETETLKIEVEEIADKKRQLSSQDENATHQQRTVAEEDDSSGESSDDDAPLKQNEANRLGVIGAGGIGVPRIGSRIRTPEINRQLSVLSLGGYEKVETGVSLTWKNLNYTVGSEDNPKVILKNISGYVGPGNVLGMFIFAFICLVFQCLFFFFLEGFFFCLFRTHNFLPVTFFLFVVVLFF